MRKEVQILWTGLVILFGLAGLVLLVVFNLGFDFARSAADLLAKDGSADPFTLDRYLRLRPLFSIFGVIFLALAGSMLAWKNRSLGLAAVTLALLERFLKRFAVDTRQFAASLSRIRLARAEILLLAAMILLAVIVRVFFVMQPFKHDEAYTVAVFANQPLRDALSDYHLPNNHLFHTLLVHMVYSVLGYLQWAVRLPSLVAGVLVVPALYLLARSLHGRTVAFIAAAAAAAMPVMIEFSTQSRGYTLLMLFSLLLFTLGIYVRRRPNLLAWALIVVVVVLGIYTIPIFYFSYISFLLWLGLGWLVGDIDFQAYGSRWKFIGWGFVSGLLTVILTVLLYTPPVLRSGLNNVLPYQVSDPMSYALFMQDVNVRLTQFVELVMMNLPGVLLWILALGFVLSLILPVRSETVSPQMHGRVSLQIAVMVGTFGLIFGLRAPPWARFLTFLVPLGLMWAAAGWVGLLRWLQKRLPVQWKLENALAGLVLVFVLVGSLVHFQTNPVAGFDVVGYEEQVTRFLQGELQEQDFIIVAHPQDAALWYYWRLYGLDPVHFRRDRSFNRTFALVDPAFDQTLDIVLAERGPDRTLLDLAASKVVFQVGSLQLIEIPIR
jgi:uncharacterized membrane protein